MSQPSNQQLWRYPRVISSASPYLERYAEPEARLASRLPGGYRAAVVVPICDEAPDFVAGLLPALRHDTLLVVVVNARDDHDERVHAANAACLGTLVARSAARLMSEDPPAWLGVLEDVPCVILDRTSAGQRFAARQGVGLARKVGLDLALALRSRGALLSRWLHSTDGDAVLPQGYLGALEGLEAAAVTYPFRHLPSGDETLDRAHAIYEIRLRHYVRGLRYAASPYAFHALGSTLALDAERYAEVRGVPKRAAGEDFHLLAKLRKLGPIELAACAPIGLRARNSSRTPFGTGRAVSKLLTDEHTPLFEHSSSFELLRLWIETLERHAAAPVASPRAEAVACAPAFYAEAVAQALAALKVDEGLERALLHTPAHRRRARVHEWFDALRTLRFLHALRDAGLEDASWQQALSSAPFHPSGLPLDDPHACRAALER